MVSRRDVAKAGGISLLLIASLIAIEFVLVRSTAPEAFETRYGTNVLDFIALPGDRIGAFVVSEVSESTRAPVRYHAGFLDLKTGQPLGEKIELSCRSQSLSLMPDGSGVVLACWDGTIVKMQPGQAAPSAEKIAQGPIQINRMVILPDRDRWLLNGIELMSVAPSENSIRWRRQFENDDILSADYFEGQVYCGLSSGKLVQIDAESGKILRVHQFSDRALMSLVIAPGGRHLAVVLADGQMIVSERPAAVDVAPVKQWRTISTSIFRPAFSPCGKYVVAPDNGDEGRMHIFDATTGRKLNEAGVYRGVIGARWSTDGNTLFVWGYDGRIRSRPIDGEYEHWCLCPTQDRLAAWPVLFAQVERFSESLSAPRRGQPPT